uniref:Uncharacterized protein n=1 Tax=Anopheles culicifacies TaxID=139723 RepID=A0A182MKN1_9DIPT
MVLLFLLLLLLLLLLLATTAERGGKPFDDSPRSDRFDWMQSANSSASANLPGPVLEVLLPPVDTPVVSSICGLTSRVSAQLQQTLPNVSEYLERNAGAKRRLEPTAPMMDLVLKLTRVQAHTHARTHTSKSRVNTV